MRACFILFFGFAVHFHALVAVSPDHRQHMIDHLSVIRAQMEDGYAPQQWKEEHRQWSLNDAFKKAKDRILTEETPSLKFFQRVVRDFLHTTKDYHVGIAFASTESATLPFTVKGVDGHYFITYINRKRMPSSSFPFSKGDEIVAFDGVSTREVVEKLQREELSGACEATDRSLAEIYLTHRMGNLGLEIPQGAVEIQVKGTDEDDEAVTYQLSWDYQPEKVTDNLSLIKREDSSAFSFGGANLEKSGIAARLIERWAGAKLEAPFAKGLTSVRDENPFALGSRKSMLPKLGRRLWDSDDYKPFLAYLYESPDKHLVGYLRIPSYGGGTREAEVFGKLIEFFQESSDALVIDQLNNPGGAVFYLYAMASMLTDKALATPKHRMTLTPSDVLWAVDLLELMDLIRSDGDAQLLLGDDIQGYPNTYQTAQFIKGFCRLILKEWKEGKTYTSPTHLFGVDHINPHSSICYTKPILLLTNELDFSGGDFFPAILQDNERVTIMGARTAGAGGYVQAAQFCNLFGIEYFSYTGSLAIRKDGQPIEDLGVTPDVPYSLTKKDLQENFADFKKAINEQIHLMLGGEKESAEASVSDDAQ